MPVLVSLGCYKKVPWTGWLIDIRNLSLTVLVARHPRSGSSMVRCGEDALPNCRLQTANFSLPPHVSYDQLLSAITVADISANCPPKQQKPSVCPRRLEKCLCAQRSLRKETASGGVMRVSLPHPLPSPPTTLSPSSGQ